MAEVKQKSVRSYGQFCGLARALDVVGDRWSLLIVRELLPGPQRYGELVASLGGIATNLLADRLRSLESFGVVERRPGRISGVVYALTPWGEGLRETVEAFVRWSFPLMTSGRGDDTFQPRWLAVALEALLRGKKAEPPAELGIEVAGLFMTLRIDNHGPHVIVQPDQRPDTILEAEPEAVLGLAAGAITLDQALSWASVHGDPSVVTTVLAGAPT
ncbi:winged helix-turn-helix transcriptional regulator [Nocardia beijingensis]|uniref:winged helix-turn-helix transcriptional regulator n=1 Tax=Nocardia beijingensis TaxID=95162 RepID=UPI001893F960|nr:helix-turn-helix domain-containing protein [Nocardia beijingensis]MBF6465655.1 winged helix-turn-helix transcriptional regulator [Nocardia beijingensis]